MQKTRTANFDINVNVIVGRLVRDCEVRDTTKGKVVKFRIASSNGEYQPTFIDCESWNINEKIIQYLVKGKEVYITQARLMSDEWTTKEGEKRSKNFLSVKELTLGKSPSRNKSNNGDEESFENEIESFLDETPEDVDPDSKPF